MQSSQYSSDLGYPASVARKVIMRITVAIGMSLDIEAAQIGQDGMVERNRRFVFLRMFCSNISLLHVYSFNINA